MAHRLQMKLGVVPDAERAPDSPDTALHVEPRVGVQTRTKGHLYLLVTSRVPGPKARDATRLVADAIRSEYYYDESAGIRVCLVKAIQVANKRLSHAREKSALGSSDPGPIGVGACGRPRQRAVRVHRRSRRGVPEPRRPPFDAPGSASRSGSAVAGRRAGRLARRDQRRRSARARIAAGGRRARRRFPQRRTGDAPPAVGRWTSLHRRFVAGGGNGQRWCARPSRPPRSR